MTEQEQVKNIIAFFSILFGEDEFINALIKIPPDYLLEKFNRYIKSTRPESDWGLHPSLRRDVFEVYCNKWNIPCEQYEYIGE